MIVFDVVLELSRAPLLAGIPNCICATSANFGRLGLQAWVNRRPLQTFVELANDDTQHAVIDQVDRFSSQWNLGAVKVRTRMIDLAMVYPSRVKETTGEELLYSPLALAYLARHTPPHYRVSAYDEYVGADFDPDRVHADVVAVSAITPGITRAYAIADRLRHRGIKTIVGGAHASALPDEALQHFDSVCVGEGEGPWKQFLQDFERGSIQQIYRGRMDVPLDGLRTPRRDLIHPNYQYPSVMTSRGCPHGCSFCYLTVFPNRKYRTIPHDTVLWDLDSLRDPGIVIVTDENFIGYSEADVEDRKALLERMIRRRYKFYWGCQASTKLASEPELMDLMYRAGCRAVFLGFEAIDKEGLAQINKGHNIGLDYEQVVARLHEHKLAVIASTIYGLDSHGSDYPDKLIAALRRCKADFPRVFFATAWPGTPFYAALEKEGRTCQNWDEVRKDLPSIQFKNFSHEEAIVGRKKVLDAFFNLANMSRTIARWAPRERSLVATYVKMVVRNRIAEAMKSRRSYVSMGA